MIKKGKINMLDLKPKMTNKDTKILKRELLHEGFCRIEKFTLQNKLFRGGWTSPYEREIMVKHKAAVALPYDPVLDKVVLIEQFRAGALFQNEISPWLIELVAGIMDKEESFISLIRREMLEEAGLEILELKQVYNYLASPGASTEEIVLFYAKVDSTKAPEFSGLSEENEDIRIHVVTSAEAFAAVNSGRINNASAMIGLLWLQLNLGKLR